jgi:hypothetical protein
MTVWLPDLECLRNVVYARARHSLIVSGTRVSSPAAVPAREPDHFRFYPAC